MAIVNSEHMVFDRTPLFIELGIATKSHVKAMTGAGYGNFIDFGGMYDLEYEDVYEDEEL